MLFLQVYRLDSHTNEVSIISPMNKKRAHQGVAVLNGRLYVVGGFYDTYIKSVER